MRKCVKVGYIVMENKKMDCIFEMFVMFMCLLMLKNNIFLLNL